MKGVRKICEIKKIPADTKVSEGGGCRQVRNKGVKLSLEDSGSVGKVLLFFLLLTVLLY